MSEPRDIAIHDNDADVSYHFWTNGAALGYEIHFPDNRIEFIYLNPSDGSDDGTPTVFVYQGTEADPGADTALCYFDVSDKSWNPADAMEYLIEELSEDARKADIMAQYFQRHDDGATAKKYRARAAALYAVIAGSKT